MDVVNATKDELDAGTEPASTVVALEEQSCAVSKPHLPFELVEAIIKDAWSSSDFGSKEFEHTRWMLYYSLSLVSHQWRAIIQDIARNHVIIETPQDVLAYDRLNERGNIVLQGNIPQAMQVVYKPSHLRLTIDKDLLSVSVRRTSYMYVGATPSSIIRWSKGGPGWDSFFRLVRSLVPLCRSAQVMLVTEEASGEALKVFSGLSSLESLYLIWDKRKQPHFRPNVLLPSVTFLRVRCTLGCCRDCSSFNYSDSCLSHFFLNCFPNLRHLHLEEPFFLKRLRLSSTLDTMILDAPPTRFIPLREPFSTVMGWNIGAALNRGFIQPSGSHLTCRRIVVNSGSEDPMGWTSAIKACDAHGVKLERQWVFLIPK